MSYVIPGSDLSPEDKKNHRHNTLQMVMRRAVYARLVKNEQELIIRDLNPEDLNLESWATPALTRGWVEWFSEAPVNKVVGIYKCLQLSPKPKISSISFIVGGIRVALHDLESCYGGLPILENLQKVLMDPEARRILDTLSGKPEEGAKPILCSTMEAWFTEPVIVDNHVNLKTELSSRRDFGAGDYLVLGGLVAEQIGITIA
jgi:hypothetical protein